MEIFRQFSTEIIFVLLATAGGVARYLNGYANGSQFKFSIFCASAAVAGFSGYMFALLGTSLNFNQPMLFMMAGIGGFFGEQTLKLMLELAKGKVK